MLLAVLPFCFVNCLILGLVAFYRTQHEFGFSPTGHGLLTLLVSFLVISKVNLAYDRFRAVRKHSGDAFMQLRELVQIVISISSSYSPLCDDKGEGNQKNENDESDDENIARELRYWRLETVSKISELMDATVYVVKDRDLACLFARNTPLPKNYWKREEDEPPDNTALDPMSHVQSLRMHLYCTADLGIQLLERVSLTGKLQEFVVSYNDLLILASTPLPFPLVQMGRAFLFLWTFSMPLVLLGGPFSELWVAQIFLFFLTYGFIGLELVSIKLSDPFGDSRDDVQIEKIRDASIIGIQNDLKGMEFQMTLSERRLQFSQQKRRFKKRRTDMADAQNPMAHHSNTAQNSVNFSSSYYHAMDAGDDHNHGC